MPQPSQTLPLHPDYLDANRAGKVADPQRAALRRFDRGPVSNNLIVAAACVVVAVVLVFNHSPARYASLRPYAAVAAIAGAVWLVLRSLGIGGRLAHDLAAGRVESIEGAIAKGRAATMGAPEDTSVFYLDVAGRRFWVYHHTYEVAPDAGIVRLYYLPTSHHVVNLERLADRPLPAGATITPLGVIESVAPALRSHDRAARADAAATMVALENAMGAERARVATPPPATERDPRPLPEAIVGQWHGVVSLRFNANGSLVATLPDGQERRGHWSVDSTGRLHASGIDGDQVGEAWIVGDTLTLVSGGVPLTLRRG